MSGIGVVSSASSNALNLLRGISAAEAKTSDLNSSDSNTKSKSAQTASSGNTLSESELATVESMAKRDREVRQHEQAHLAVSGGLATSGASYSMETGPDGKQYAMGGEVKIDVGPGNTPEETLSKARIIQAAALAPADPSGADRAIAAAAAAMAQNAQAEIAKRSPTEQKLAAHYGQNEYPKSALATSA
ncbi:putative metalloprotease CJM1_0395 family protein [Iodobacter fluviatilis]|uniref:SprA family protein n=1 Tax=Iodobacter fluviatilis TaxID=537 RepID=A0A377Q6J7_9NEIS|nr:putative metalloprotease CJM1_0395 family protein [Iodobacter fluviatilis]TCU87023.1 SprA family protein [Iodobacter fluviatilis]STQ90355.1 SprA-related family [Iodobacter fluviatilis]